MPENQFNLELLKIEPSNVRVRTFSNLSIIFSLNFTLPKDSSLIVRLRGGRNNKNDWYCLQPYNANSKGYTVLSVDENAKLKPILITGKDLYIKYLICGENGIKKNTRFRLKIYNTLVQSLVEKNKKIDILVEFPNKKQQPILLNKSPTIEVINGDLVPATNCLISIGRPIVDEGSMIILPEVNATVVIGRNDI